MPIYEYECSDCGHRLEVLQYSGEPTLTECPACARGTLRKLMSAAGFRLSGGGWYETDFKTGGKRNLAGDAKPEAQSEPKSDAKSDAKSETRGADARPSDKGGGAGEPKKTSGAPAAPAKPAARPSPSPDKGTG